MLFQDFKNSAHYYRTLILILMFTSPLLAHTAEPPVMLLAETSPFTLKSPASIHGGEATIFVESLLEHADQNYQLSYQPWKRAYLNAQTKPNALIYPIARASSREDQFHWVGQLIPVTYYLFRVSDKNHIKVDSLDDAKNWKVGVVNEHIHHQYLKSQGFNNLQSVNSNYQNIKKALLGRIDLFPMSDGGMMQLCSRDELDCSSFKPVLKLHAVAKGLYLAASRNTDPSIIHQLKDSYQVLVNNGQHEKILRQRLLRIEAFNQRWATEFETLNAN